MQEEKTKEILTKENIKRDLKYAASRRFSNRIAYRLDFVIPWLFAAILVGALTRILWIAALMSIFPAYHLVQLAREYIPYRKNVSRIIRGEFSVHRDTLVKICSETIYEPWVGRRGRIHYYKEVSFFHFEQFDWRVVYGKHYTWSDFISMSTTGLENTSVEGNTFFVAVYNNSPEVGYVYNTKFFIWNEEELNS